MAWRRGTVVGERPFAHGRQDRSRAATRGGSLVEQGCPEREQGWWSPVAESQACCGVRCASLLRRVAGDVDRRGQVQAQRRMKARISTSSPMEKP